MRLQDTQPEALSLEKHNELISRYIPREYLLSAVDASAIGVVICDRRFRYKALNGSVAKMHNVSVEAHLGHTFHEILGNMAEKVVPLWENVFATGKPLSDLHINGQLPKRSDAARWILNLFPLMDSRGRVAQVGCFVVEIASLPTQSSSPCSSDNETLSASGYQARSAVRSQRTLLTPREQAIVRLVAEGKSNKEISSLLAISVRTVETYRSRLMLKLQATSIAGLVHYAIRNHIVTP